MIKLGGIAELFEREECVIGFAFDDDELGHEGGVLFFHLGVMESEGGLCFLSLISHKYKFDIFIRIVKLNIIMQPIFKVMLQNKNVSLSRCFISSIIPFTTHQRLTHIYYILTSVYLIIASRNIGTASYPNPLRTLPRNSPSSPRKTLRLSSAPPSTSTMCESGFCLLSLISAPSHHLLFVGSRCGSRFPCSSTRKSIVPCIHVSLPNLRNIFDPLSLGLCCQSRRSFPI